MSNFVPLNSKERKHLNAMLEKQYGCTIEFTHALFENISDQKVYMITRDIDQFVFDRIRINTIGLYLCKYNDEKTEIKLSIEGSQIVGPQAKKNVFELDDTLFKIWLKGEDVPVTVDATADSYVLVKNKKGDFLGSGRFKNGALLNFTPKTRRIMVDMPENEI